jgi:GNAT superfamily N-acetyltransferase
MWPRVVISNKAGAEQQEGKRRVFLAWEQENLAGYVHLNRLSALYFPFRHLGIPEIQDLFVHTYFRRQGIGEALVKACEAEAPLQPSRYHYRNWCRGDKEFWCSPAALCASRDICQMEAALFLSARLFQTEKCARSMIAYALC